MEYAGAEPELEAGKGNGGVRGGKRDVIVLTIKKYGINHKKDFVINDKTVLKYFLPLYNAKSLKLALYPLCFFA